MGDKVYEVLKRKILERELNAGDKVDFVEVEGGFKLVPLRKDVRALKGRFAGRVKRPVTLEEMDDAIAQAAAQTKRG